MSPALSRISLCATNSTDFYRWFTPFWSYARASLPSSTPLISCSRRSCGSDAHCHGASLIKASDNENVVCNVSCIRMADTLNTRFSDYIYCKIIVVTDIELKYFLISGVGPTAQLCKLSAWIWRVDTTWRPLSSYAFIKIKLASRHSLLYVVYVYQKLLYSIDAFTCYKQKWMLAAFNLAHPL